MSSFKASDLPANGIASGAHSLGSKTAQTTRFWVVLIVAFLISSNLTRWSRHGSALHSLVTRQSPVFKHSEPLSPRIKTNPGGSSGFGSAAMTYSWAVFWGCHHQRLASKGFDKSPESFHYLQLCAPLFLLILTRLKISLDHIFAAELLCSFKQRHPGCDDEESHLCHRVCLFNCTVGRL